MEHILIFLILSVLLSCNTTKNTQGVITSKCESFGQLVDHTGLDGCTWLIHMENGERLLPLNLSEFPIGLQNGLYINFTFVKPGEDMMSTCMAEDAIVEIKCLQVVTREGNCIDTSYPPLVDWMRLQIDKIKPDRIQKVFGEDMILYLFEKDDLRYLFNCKSELICQFNSGESKACIETVKSLDRGEVIWIGERHSD